MSKPGCMVKQSNICVEPLAWNASKKRMRSTFHQLLKALTEGDYEAKCTLLVEKLLIGIL